MFEEIVVLVSLVNEHCFITGLVTQKTWPYLLYYRKFLKLSRAKEQQIKYEKEESENSKGCTRQILNQM